ncbi:MULTISPECIES: RHS repeat-associated core domain-containing protein [unclassified Pseudomonas]|uniref:RHS repeat-associated core domain-containing protein n=1 Tax=unclassified Pseudomonas TaxID=196821 RepID=UPI0020980419|nr:MULTISPECIES: RHS repeat-associated core domain-containing protein [unclassified Pseudomonas]MCO7520894.1 DUF6531 domain-containing protein [Pseudomonas sp. 1]MCO7541334.1 DUF6531 domain-containing protein [Pseudomonas sp. VA159-2]
MDDSLHAARQGDLILHPPLMADLVSAVSEAVIYAAATAAVAAAIGGAVVAVVGTGGAAAALTPLIAGALVGAAAMLPGGEEKSLGDRVSQFSDWLGGAMFPPEPHGRIETGSGNTRINGKLAARAAGISTGPAGDAEPAPQPSFLETVGGYAMTAGMLLMPVLGLASAINDIFNPPISTPADANTEPRPLDKVTCKKHPPMPEQFLAQGSDKVFINGQPASRVGDKSTCDGPVGMTFSPDVRIGGKTMTVRDIRDGKSALAKIVGIVAGMLLSRKMKGGCSVGNPVMPSSGSKTQAGPEDLDFSLPGLLSIEWQRSYDSDDLREHGLFGKGWSVPYEAYIERIDHPEGGELWVHIDEQGVRMELGRLATGSAFVSVLDGRAFFQLEAGLTIVEDINSGQYQVFQTDPRVPRRSRLVKVGDRNLNMLDLLYDERGRLQYLADTHGRTCIELHYDAAHPERVGEVQRLLLASGADFVVQQRETLASYQYTAHGQLAVVVDSTGRQVRRFSYTDEGLMASHTLASGAVRHYAWARFEVPRQGPSPKRLDGTPYALPVVLEAQPRHQWRVVRHWGSDGEHYELSYDLELGHTQVRDSLGREEHYFWGPLAEVYRHIDALGNIWQWDMVAGQVLRRIDPLGREHHYSYDNLGRLIAIRDPLGRVQSCTYTEHWALPVSLTDSAGHTLRISYDRHGNPLSVRDPLGRETQYQHDSHGRLVQITDAQGRQRQLSWNDRGQLTAERDCSGQLTTYRYDARGHLSDTSNARGERNRFEHDARGHLRLWQHPDGRQEHYDFDAAGQLVRHRDPAGQVTQWRYDASGRVTERIDAIGLAIGFSYDAFGRILQVRNQNGEHYHFAWDALDRVSSQRNLDGSGYSFSYAATGEPTRILQYPTQEAEPAMPGSPPELDAAILQQSFEYDASGRCIRKTTADGVTDYAWDSADNLVQIVFADLHGTTEQLHFAYDALGQLCTETCGDGQLHYLHDELGNLQSLLLPDQRRINHLYYGSGHLHQLNLDGRVICDFERDELHREVLRTQGRLLTRSRYDSCGRLLQRSLHAPERPSQAMALLQKDYQYDAADNLIAELFTQSSQVTGQTMPGQPMLGALGGFSLRTSVGYDLGPTERVHGVRRHQRDRPTQQVQTYAYDGADNLLDGYRLKGHVLHDRLKVYQDKHYRYDRHGRLSEKRSGRHLLQRFEYDAEHRVVRIHQQRGSVHERIEFTYDPLGRRTHKALYRNDHPTPVSQSTFLWQGLRLLQECQDGQPCLYLYADSESHEPLARLDGAAGHEQVRYFHLNLAGLPEQMTDEAGDSLWHATCQAWGAQEEEWHAPHTRVRQNLRLQGQYLDRETGLHYNTFRYYDPDIGRFTQPDPIGLRGGLNLYRYAANALTWIDPLGLACYRNIYFNAFPRMKKFIGKLKLEVHHRIPQMYIGAGKLFPESMRTSLSNLQGLPRHIHRKVVSPMWTAFRKQHPKPTRAQVVKKAMEIDKVVSEHINKVN